MVEIRPVGSRTRVSTGQAVLLALATCLTVGAASPAVARGGARPVDPMAATARRPSVKDSPGYCAAADPESMSVVVGRRLNAPLESKRFVGGAGTLDELGRRVCRALHHGSLDSLMLLCVRDDEFRDVLWREFPQSRPATGLTWVDAWRILYARIHGGSVSAVREYGGHYYEFLGFARTDTAAVYRNFRLHNGLVLVARKDEGTIERFTWLRSVAERRGRFKIYSTDD